MRRRDRRRRPGARDAVGHVERARHRRDLAARRRLRARRWRAKRRASAALRDRLLEGLRAKTDGMTVNGAMDARLPGNLNVSFEGIDGEALLVSLDDIAVSSGAACTQAEPSHVLMALGIVEGSGARVAAIWDRAQDDGDGDRLRGSKVGDVVARLRRCRRSEGASCQVLVPRMGARCVTRTKFSIGCAIRNESARWMVRTWALVKLEPWMRARWCASRCGRAAIGSPRRGSRCLAAAPPSRAQAWWPSGWKARRLPRRRG